MEPDKSTQIQIKKERSVSVYIAEDTIVEDYDAANPEQVKIEGDIAYNQSMAQLGPSHESPPTINNQQIILEKLSGYNQRIRSNSMDKDEDQNESMEDFTQFIRQKTQKIIKFFDEAKSEQDHSDSDVSIQVINRAHTENFDQQYIDKKIRMKLAEFLNENTDSGTEKEESSSQAPSSIQSKFYNVSNDLEKNPSATEQDPSPQDESVIGVFFRIFKDQYAEIIEVDPIMLLLPELDRKRIIQETLVKVRQYISILTFLEVARMVYQYADENYRTDLSIYILQWFIIFLMGICFIMSYKQIDYVKQLVIILQIKIHIMHYESKNIFSGKTADNQQNAICTIQLGVMLITNWALISQIFSSKYFTKIFPFELLSVYIGIFRRIFGDFNKQEFFGNRSIINFVSMFTLIQLFVYITKQIINIKLRQSQNCHKSVDNLKFKLSKIYDFKTLNTLQNSILVCNKNEIIYANEFSVKQFGNPKDVMNAQIFQVFQNNTLSQGKPKQFSMKQLLKNHSSEEIYQFQFSEKDEPQFARIKLQSIETADLQDHTLIQIFDLPQKVIFSQSNAMRMFLNLINSVVYHELRNPLNSLVAQIYSMEGFFNNFFQIIQRISEHKKLNQSQTKDLASELKKIFEGLLSCGQKMTSSSQFIDYFVHDILDYTLLNNEHGQFKANIQVFDIKESLNQIERILQDKANMKNIKVKAVFENFESCNNQQGHPYMVKTDKKRMQQVLLNLLSNAMKFTQRNGKIRIKVTYLEKQLDKNSDCILLAVTDNGEGIKKENRKNIFKLFGQNEKKHDEQEVKGIGLGLAISKLIVKKFEGHIDFISKHQRGSTFFFTFKVQPYAAQEAQDALTFGSPDQQTIQVKNHSRITTSRIPILKLTALPYSKKDRIMVVDDEEFCLESVRVLLQKAGVEMTKVDFCITGQEALNKVQKEYKNGGSYKLILTDFMMPVMNGIVSTQNIRKFLQKEMLIPLKDQPKIIGITAHFIEDLIDKGQKAGMNEIYGKPVYFDQMTQILGKHYNNDQK